MDNVLLFLNFGLKSIPIDKFTSSGARNVAYFLLSLDL